MGLFKIFSENKEKNTPKFRTADGKLLTPGGYGFLSVAIGINSASESFEHLFLKNEHTSKMWLSKLATKDRFSTELVISALFVGVYLHHMFWNLNVVDDNIFTEVAKGIDDGYKNVTSNDEKAVTPQIRKILFIQASNYIKLIREDLRASATLNGSPSANFLLENISKVFTSWLNEDDLERLSEELNKSTTSHLLKAYIIDDIFATALAIEGENKIEFLIG